MKRSVITMAVAVLLIWSTLSWGDPEFRMTYPGGVPRAEIAGDYAQSRYAVWRGTSAAGGFERISDSEVLCLGSCFTDDYSAVAGRTYWYRFDLITSAGDLVSFGPYQANISTELARSINVVISPHPVRGSARIALVLASPPGGPTVEAEAALFDLHGRRVSTLFRGAKSSGTTTVAWNGRSDRGEDLRAGSYFLQFTTADGRRHVTRMVRIR